MLVGVKIAVFFAAVITDCLILAGSLAACMLGECCIADVAKVIFVIILTACHFFTAILTLVVFVFILVNTDSYIATVVASVVFVFICVTVIYRYGNFSRYIARLVGGNDFLCALCRRQSKLIVLECNFRAVYRHAVDIFFVNRYSLRSTVDLAVFNALNYRGNIIQRNTV